MIYNIDDANDMSDGMDFSPTDEQVMNLETLASYLERLPDDYAGFDISTYHQVSASGTVACSIGHGPIAGIERGYPLYAGMGDYSAYARKVFGTDEFQTKEGVYMFSIDNENGHIPAAKRIREVLTSLK